MPNPFYIDSDENPNEAFGVRACSFSDQQKHADCGGPWRTWHSVLVVSPAPRLTVCHNHLRTAASDLFVTPTVTEKPRKPPKTRAANAELSL